MQPFHFKALDESNVITLSLEAAFRADAVSKALKVKNAVARSFRRRKRLSVPATAGAPAMAPVAEEGIDDDEEDDGEEDDATASMAARGAAPVLFRGFMTKQGAVRRNWKRRFFELHTTGMAELNSQGECGWGCGGW